RRCAVDGVPRRCACWRQVARRQLASVGLRTMTRLSPPLELAALLKSYRVSRVTGDRYAGEFPRELFRKHGIAYDLAKQTKSELFRDLLPLLNSGRIVLPHNDRLLRLGVAPARLAGTPSRIPTAATMTWQ